MSPLVLWDAQAAAWRAVTAGTVTPPPDPDPDPDPPLDGLEGWFRTTTNTGLAGAGVTEAMLTAGPSVPQYGGSFSNISGTHYRKRFDLGGNVIAPATGTRFEECLITGDGSLVNLFGTNVELVNCDLRISGAWTTSENVHVNGHPLYAGSGARVLIQGCKMTGGTIFVNLTSMGGDVIGCYGYGQQPEVGGQQHRDGFTSRGASANNKIRVLRSRFDCDQNSTTGAFFLQDTYGSGVAGVEASQNLFEGAGYCVAIENATQLTFTDNRIRQHGSYQVGALTTVGSTGTWTWTDNALYAPTPPDYRGATVAKP